jgi:hypothetical protein
MWKSADANSACLCKWVYTTETTNFATFSGIMCHPDRKYSAITSEYRAMCRFQMRDLRATCAKDNLGKLKTNDEIVGRNCIFMDSGNASIIITEGVNWWGQMCSNMLRAVCGEGLHDVWVFLGFNTWLYFKTFPQWIPSRISAKIRCIHHNASGLACKP